MNIAKEKCKKMKKIERNCNIWRAILLIAGVSLLLTAVESLSVNDWTILTVPLFIVSFVLIIGGLLIGDVLCQRLLLSEAGLKYGQKLYAALYRSLKNHPVTDCRRKAPCFSYGDIRRRFFLKPFLTYCIMYF